MGLLKKNIFSVFSSLIIFIIFFSTCAAENSRERLLVVGVTESPPFSFQEDGRWEGLSLEIWRAVAGKMDARYEIRPYTVNGLLEALRSGEADVGAAALFITARREHFMNFTHSFYLGGLGIATKASHSSMFRMFLNILTRGEFLRVVFTLGIVLLIVGFSVWLAEKKVNPSHFPKNPLRGIGSGFWFSAVTMTTVGYGDKAPVSFVGRVVGLIWMFASIVLISTFTGAVASTLTVSTISPRIKNFDDLYLSRVGAVAGSQATEYLREHGISFKEFPDTLSGLETLKDGAIDGFVNDEVLLRYLVKRNFPGEIIVLERGFETGFYAMGLQKDSPLRDEINLHLLEYVQGPEWPRVLRRYLGN